MVVTALKSSSDAFGRIGVLSNCWVDKVGFIVFRYLMSHDSLGFWCVACPVSGSLSIFSHFLRILRWVLYLFGGHFLVSVEELGVDIDSRRDVREEETEREVARTACEQLC